MAAGARPAPEELPSQMCGAKLRTPTYSFSQSTPEIRRRLANLAGRRRRQTSPDAISIQKGPRPEGPDIRFIASSARKEGHLMWPSSCAGLSEQETLYPAPPVGDRTHTTTASYLDRRRRRTARFHLGRIYGERPPRSWRRYRCRQTRAAPSRGSPDDRAS